MERKRISEETKEERALQAVLARLLKEIRETENKIKISNEDFRGQN